MATIGGVRKKAKAGVLAIFWAAFLSFTGHGLAQAPLRRLVTIYSFTGVDGDGSFPLAGLTIGKDGVLYGTTNQGGTGNPGEGTVFDLKPPTAEGSDWTESVLYRFLGAPDATSPQAGVVLGAGGLYGGQVANSAWVLCSKWNRPKLAAEIGPRICCTVFRRAETEIIRRVVWC